MLSAAAILGIASIAVSQAESVVEETSETVTDVAEQEVAEEGTPEDAEATEAAVEGEAPAEEGEAAADETAAADDERAIVNALVGLLVSGGSTNHTLHLIAMAAAAGITLNWDDFTALSAVTPSLMQVYPNGQADINHFQAAGGMSYLFRELLAAGLIHGDIPTVFGTDLTAYTKSLSLRTAKLSGAKALRRALTKTFFALSQRLSHPLVA